MELTFPSKLDVPLALLLSLRTKYIVLTLGIPDVSLQVKGKLRICLTTINLIYQPKKDVWREQEDLSRRAESRVSLPYQELLAISNTRILA